MFDLQLVTETDAENPTIGDLKLVKGDIVWVIEKIDQVVQQARIRLLSFRGDWFLDLREGVPYFEDVLVKNPNAGRIRAIMRQSLLGIPSVIRVPDLVLAFDKAQRLLRIRWSLVLDDGTVIRSEDFGPFVLELDA
jgi:hypothetical protein